MDEIFVSRAKDREEQIAKFWTSADFGYIKERLGEMTVFCKPEASESCALVTVIIIANCLQDSIIVQLK